MFEKPGSIPTTLAQLHWGDGGVHPSRRTAPVGTPDATVGSTIVALQALSAGGEQDAAAGPGRHDPFAAECFPHLRAVTETPQRLLLIHEAVAGYSPSQRATAIGLAGSVLKLLGSSGIDAGPLRHYFPESGAPTDMPPMDPAQRNDPSNKPRFDAAVQEVRSLYDALDGWPDRPDSAGRIESAHIRFYALTLAARMGPAERERVAINSTGTRLVNRLKITSKYDVAAFQRAISRNLQRRGPSSKRCEGRTPVDDTSLPPAKRALWDRTAQVMQDAAIEPVPAADRYEGGPSANQIRRAKTQRVRMSERLCIAKRVASDFARSRSLVDYEVCNRIAIVLASDPEHANAFLLLNREWRSWMRVSLALCLSWPGYLNPFFCRAMTGSPEFRQAMHSEAVRYLAVRALDKGFADADARAKAELIARLNAETIAARWRPKGDKRGRTLAIDDFILAAAHFSTAEMSFCMQRGCAAMLSRRLDLHCRLALTRVVGFDGHWKNPMLRRVEALLADKDSGRVERPLRVELMRQSIAAMLSGGRDAPQHVLALRVPVDPATRTDAPADVSRQPVVKPEPGLLAEPAQVHCVDIRARRPDGSDWLAGLDLAAAVISEQSWAALVNEHLQPCGIRPAQQAALRARLAVEMPAALLRVETAESLAQRFQFVTTLDDGRERGMGVITRAARKAFSVLFIYGGTVCATEAEADAYRDEHLPAWKYALNVRLRDDPAGGDATCFGYPAGNIATRLNARRLEGSPGQLRRAANVGHLLLRVPGLPFGLPVLLTLRPLAAGKELFLDYGQAFGRFVAQFVRALPAWPTVKVESGSGPRPTPTMEQFIRAYRQLPEGPVAAADPTWTAGPPLRDWSACLAGCGYELRTGRADPTCLNALAGRDLDATQAQQFRHDLADTMARWIDTEESSRRNADDIAALLRRRYPAMLQAGEPVRSLVPNVVYADFQRVPGAEGGESDIRAWCESNDDRERSRFREKPGRRAPTPPTIVAVLAHEGFLIVLGAASRHVTDLRGLDDAALGAVMLRELGRVSVAMLRTAHEYREILQAS